MTATPVDVPAGVFTKNVAATDTSSPGHAFTAPTSGHLLISGLANDKDSGTITVPSGWTEIGTNYESGSSVSGGAAYKFSDGTETADIVWSWTDSQDDYALWIGEYSGIDTVDLNAQDNNAEDTDASISSGTTGTLTQDDDTAWCFYGVDSSQNMNTGRAFSNSFSDIEYVGDDASNPCGLQVTTKELTATTGAESTFSASDNGDQLFGKIVCFYLASVGVTGTLAETLDDATSAASGQVGIDVTGTLAETLDDATSAAAGQVGLDVTGTLAETLDDATSDATGVVGGGVTGTLAETLDDATSAAAGQVGIDVTGTLAETLEAFTSDVTGQVGVDVTGTLAETLDDATSAASGQVGIDVTGTLAETLEAFTSDATGQVGVDVTGTLAETLEAFTSDATGQVGVPVGNVIGSLAVTLDDFTSDAAGGLFFKLGDTSVVSSATVKVAVESATDDVIIETATDRVIIA